MLEKAYISVNRLGRDQGFENSASESSEENEEHLNWKLEKGEIFVKY